MNLKDAPVQFFEGQPGGPQANTMNFFAGQPITAPAPVEAPKPATFFSMYSNSPWLSNNSFLLPNMMRLK